jgi:hypothetical protein
MIYLINREFFIGAGYISYIIYVEVEVQLDLIVPLNCRPTFAVTMKITGHVGILVNQTSETIKS